MKCCQAQEWMSERLDGVLEPARSQLLDQHLAGCPECAQEWIALAASWKLLGSLPELEPSPLFRARVWEKIRLAPPPQRSPWPALRSWWAGLAVAAALALVVGLGYHRPEIQPSAAPTQLAANAAAPRRSLPAEPIDSTQGWDSFEVIPSVDILAQEDPLDEQVSLGVMSDDYLACSQKVLDDTLEGL